MFSTKKISLHYAQKAITYTLENISASSNLIPREDMLHPHSLEIIKAVNEMRDINIPYEPYTFEWVTRIAELAQQFKVGNCCEKSCVAFVYLKNELLKLPPENRPSIELFNNPFSDHFFIIISRDEFTNASDLRTWNPDTVICDPWGKENYKISDIPFNLLTNKMPRIIQHLLSPTNALVLQNDVLAKANGDPSRIITSQDCMVLRSRLDLRKNHYQVFNENVPITYEAWDFPKPKHYTKQQLNDNTSQSVNRCVRMSMAS